MTVLAVFRSRAQALDFSSRMGKKGVVVRLLNTPKEAGVGCSLSASFDEAYLGQARLAIKYGNYSSFSGFLFSDRRYGGYFKR
jgi:hypothetical protein